MADRVAYEPGDASKLPFADGSFDAVLCHNMLHHVAEPLVAVKEMSRVAKADGSILIRDLVRVASFLVPFHVNLLGLTYNRLMKKEYRDSIRAALSPREWRALYQESALSGARLTRQFITHQGIERPARNRRGTHTQIPTPVHLRPFKSMYVSRYPQSMDHSEPLCLSTTRASQTVQLGFQPCDQAIQLVHDGPDAGDVAQIDPGALQKHHGVIAAPALSNSR